MKLRYLLFTVLLTGTIFAMTVFHSRAEETTISVSDSASLASAIRSANQVGGYRTILLEPGTYILDQMLHIYTDNITVKGNTDDYNDVIIKGKGMHGGVSHIFLVAASHFTVENLSMGEVGNHLIQVQGEKGASYPTVRNCRFFDSYEQMLKVSGKGVDGQRSVGGLVEDCAFEYTAGIGPQYYIGGVDAHASDNWIIRNNTFMDIISPESALAEHAIHFWSGSTGTLVQGNTIIDCDRGIGFGLGSSTHGEGQILGNTVYSSRDVGIGLESAGHIEVAGNYVYTPNYMNAIEYRFSGTSASIHDNIVYGAIAQRQGGQATLTNNLTSDFSDWHIAENTFYYKNAAETATPVYEPVNVDAPASWAKEAVDFLDQHTAVKDSHFSHYDQAISRKDFAHLAVILYESLTDEALPTPGPSPFSDTSDEDVLKAYDLGIIQGYGNGLFGPNDDVTREQVAVMFVRTIEKAGYALDASRTTTFGDHAAISSWAQGSVYKAYNKGIINGVGDSQMAPKSLTTREQALVITYNTLQKKGSFETATVTVMPIARTGGTIQAPVLKWQHGGAFNSWAETGWYSTPAVADLNGDGRLDMIGSAYSVVSLDAETGSLNWRAKSGYDRSQPDADNVGRTWSDVVVKDIDGDGQLEAITAHGKGYVSVYDHQGYFQSGWPKQPVAKELRGLKVADLDLDGTDEIIVTAAVGSKENIWVYEHDGSLRSGWPQLSNDSGYAYGVFNNNVSVGNLTGDSILEIVLPSDVHYICAYDDHGNQLTAHPMYGDRKWGKVGVWEAFEIELRGWGVLAGSRDERYRANFAHGASVITDVDGNGTNEVVAIGNVYDATIGHPPGLYNGLYIFNSDRSRFNNGTYDWTTVPLDTGAPLSENYNVIENNQPDPVVEDVDGDGLKEIVFSSYDGRVHCYHLDKTEHDNWPYRLNQSGGMAFASVPEVMDLNEDGHKEVIFTSWREKSSGLNGHLYILDYQGNLLHKTDLPTARSAGKSNGALASPRVVDSNGDGSYEIYINTIAGGFARYDVLVN